MRNFFSAVCSNTVTSKTAANLSHKLQFADQPIQLYSYYNCKMPFQQRVSSGDDLTTAKADGSSSCFQVEFSALEFSQVYEVESKSVKRGVRRSKSLDLLENMLFGVARSIPTPNKSGRRRSRRASLAKGTQQ
jgi:hypothetical protein